MKVQIAIDGACKNNGKPACCSMGAAAIRNLFDDGRQCLYIKGVSLYESTGSSNQRGELNALLIALHWLIDTSMATEAQIITDSEYIFNSMTKDWISSWERKGWVTASLEPVKNQDIWKQIKEKYDEVVGKGVEINFYHVKGHVINLPEVGTTKLLDDIGINAVFNEACRKYMADGTTKALERKQKAVECAEKNMGYAYTDDVLKTFSALNACADVLATRMLSRKCQ